MARNTYFLIIILVATVFLLAFVWPQAVNNGINFINKQAESVGGFKLPKIPEKQFQLGLDLLGGAHLLYEADLSKVEIPSGEAVAAADDAAKKKTAAPRKKVAAPKE